MMCSLISLDLTSYLCKSFSPLQAARTPTIEERTTKSKRSTARGHEVKVVLQNFFYLDFREAGLGLISSLLNVAVLPKSRNLKYPSIMDRRLKQVSIILWSQHLTVTMSGEAQSCGKIVIRARRWVPGLMPTKTEPSEACFSKTGRFAIKS